MGNLVSSRKLSKLREEPLHALLQTIASASRAGENLPRALSQLVQAKLCTDFIGRQSVEKVLLVRHDEQGHVGELLLAQ